MRADASVRCVIGSAAVAVAGAGVEARGKDRAQSSDPRHGPADRDPHCAGDDRPARVDRGQAGQHVRKGDLLAVLDNPELAASVGEAEAAAASAKAERDHVYSGVRAEEVAIANQAVRTAEANLVLAQQQHDRAAALTGKNFASRQQLDESTASLAKAQADLDLKRAQAAEASAGPTAEERALADAGGAGRSHGRRLQAKLDKTRLLPRRTAPSASASPSRARSSDPASR